MAHLIGEQGALAEGQMQHPLPLRGQMGMAQPVKPFHSALDLIQEGRRLSRPERSRRFWMSGG
jgi:hypothetical protein